MTADSGPALRARVVLAHLMLLLCWQAPALAAGWAPPGDPVLRQDLQRLNDVGVIDLPLTSWPLAWADIDRGLAGVDADALPPGERAAYERLRQRLRRATAEGPRYHLAVSAASEPRLIRSFEDTPREDGQVAAGVSWFGDRLALNLAAAVVVDPLDGDEIRPDGSFIGLRLGNWLLSAGWQARWWGPGRDGSLILSSNARPTPGFAVQRQRSTPFGSRWLHWIGPWTLTAFMTRLDDQRVINDALLFGVRAAFKPLDDLEIGLSRTAQWCGDDRPCDLGAFRDLLLGNDNRGVNVDPNEEPGNQLAGIDMRWALPRDVPVALYMQWIGEDSRRGGPEIGSWLRQAGIEYRGRLFGLEHQTHFEFTDTMCREGGFGFGDTKPDCAYEHSIYQTGYRYDGRVMGYATDGDGRTWSLGSSLVDAAGHAWQMTLRRMEINRAGAPDARHSISPTPQDLGDILLSHDRLTALGRFRLGLGYSRLEDTVSGATSDDVAAFIQWSTE